MPPEQDRRDYAEVVKALDRLNDKLDHSVESIFKRLDDHILNTCVLTRMEMEKKITRIETKQGIFSSFFGFLGGAFMMFLSKFLGK